MKTKIFIILVAGVLLIGGNLYAGDLNVSGNLGVGTTSPSNILHLKSSAPYLFYERTGAYAHTWSFGFYFDSFAILDSVSGSLVDRLVIDTSGNIGIGTGSPQVKLQVNGNTASVGYYTSSDIRWKKNIMPLENSLGNVLKLQGVNYEWKTEEYKDRGFKEGKQIGLVAQEVEQVIPELVNTDKEGYKSVSYEKLTAVLVEAIKEQQKEIEDLKSELKQMRDTRQ